MVSNDSPMCWSIALLSPVPIRFFCFEIWPPEVPKNRQNRENRDRRTKCRITRAGDRLETPDHFHSKERVPKYLQTLNSPGRFCADLEIRTPEVRTRRRFGDQRQLEYLRLEKAPGRETWHDCSLLGPLSFPRVVSPKFVSEFVSVRLRFPPYISAPIKPIDFKLGRQGVGREY